MKLVWILLTGLALAACGADGEPVYPAASNVVTVSNSGISVSTNVAVNEGPLTVSVGVGI